MTAKTTTQTPPQTAILLPEKGATKKVSDAQRVADFAIAYSCSLSTAQMLKVFFDTVPPKLAESVWAGENATVEWRGRVLAHDTMAERLRELTADYPTMDGMKSQIRQCRKALKGKPWHVEVVRAIGWRIAYIVEGPKV